MRTVPTHLIQAFIEALRTMSENDRRNPYNTLYRARVEETTDEVYGVRVLTTADDGELVAHPLWDDLVWIPHTENPHDIDAIELDSLIRIGFYEGRPDDAYIDAVLQGKVVRRFRGRLDLPEEDRPEMQLVAGKGHGVQVTIDGESLKTYLTGKLVDGLSAPVTPAPVPWEDFDVEGEITEGFPDFSHEAQS